MRNRTDQPSPLLYLAGPYTKPDPVINVRRTLRVANALIEHTTWLPFVPHLTMLWHLAYPQPIEWWYKLDLRYLDHCEALLRLPGESTGADAEVQYAWDHRIHVYSLEDMDRAVQEAWGEADAVGR